MSVPSRRGFLRRLGQGAAVAGVGGLPPAIARALSIEPSRRTGTLKDVGHVVILMQENRSFDHYFGTMRGVRGFGDRFAIPVSDGAGGSRPIWHQPTRDGKGLIAPFHLNTAQQFAHMRMTGTPHSWADAQAAWDQGRMSAWPRAKHDHSMGYFRAEDIPFQHALANAFTLCDAYHCSVQTGTCTNRLFHWTGTNDPLALAGGPATDNSHEFFKPDPADDYRWMTYPERLLAAGIRWQVYQNMADNFHDNPLAGFRPFRDAWYGRPGYSQELKQRGISTRDLDLLKEDVQNNRLPQVSWIVATEEGSEHPDPSSPAQGADYTARVLDALTSNPEVWSKTVFLVNFDENDGFFDHMPPPAPPSYLQWHADPAQASFAGASTVSTEGEYHEVLNGTSPKTLHRPYGLGPRVPLYVVSPWSRGGWVNSQVSDHTSVIRFLEARFGVMEPNISAWRRAVCGDLTSAFDFAKPSDLAFFKHLPLTQGLADRARKLPAQTTPARPSRLETPQQEAGVRPARPLPYAPVLAARVNADTATLELGFGNEGLAAVVFHVYDRLSLKEMPRRYTVEPGLRLQAEWAGQGPDAAYDLWVLGPNGFHRRLSGSAADADVEVAVAAHGDELRISVSNSGTRPHRIAVRAEKYRDPGPIWQDLAPGERRALRWPLLESQHWYDFSVTVAGLASFARRLAGHVETGRASTSDPALGDTR